MRRPQNALRPAGEIHGQQTGAGQRLRGHGGCRWRCSSACCGSQRRFSACAQELLQQARDFCRYPKERSPAEQHSARKLRCARKEKQFSLEQEAELQALQQAEQKTEEAQQKAGLQRRQKTEVLLQQVRDLGRYPKENAGRSLAERQLAEKIRRARKANQISPEQEAELKALQQAEQQAEQKTEVLLQQVRDLGRYPKENARRSLAERQLAEKIRKARKAKQLSPEQEADIKALQQAESDARVAARIAEAGALPNPFGRVR